MQEAFGKLQYLSVNVLECNLLNNFQKVTKVRLHVSNINTYTCLHFTISHQKNVLQYLLRVANHWPESTKRICHCFRYPIIDLQSQHNLCPTLFKSTCFLDHTIMTWCFCFPILHVIRHTLSFSLFCWLVNLELSGQIL